MIGRLYSKPGVVVVLTNPHVWFIVEVMLKACESAMCDCVVTSGVEGEHEEGSKHYELAALDFRGNHVEPEVRAQIVEQAKAELGKDYDVVDSAAGAIHIEYDPKGEAT